MANFQRISTVLMITSGALALAACGANDIASPGTGGNVTITNTTVAPPPPPPPPVATLVTPAPGCPTIPDPQGLTQVAEADGRVGLITGPTGTYRVCTLPARLNVSTTLTRTPGLLYRLGGRVDVGTDQGPASTNNVVTLSIEPGVVVFGGTGVSWLNINRGNRIMAVGTATQPIVFTSRDNVLGLSTDMSIGQWGGVVLSGRAPVTDCAATGAAPGTIACERQVEGALDPALYGGASPGDNSGRISFAQIRFSGFVLSGNSELQSLTTGGVGSATVLDHIQSFNSSDDGAEFFGGNVNMRYFASIGADDDNLDTDVGVKANFQYVLAVQRTGAGDSMIEADSDNARENDLPRQNVNLSNFTFIQRSSTVGNRTAIRLGGGTDYTAVNGVIVSPNTTCLRISRVQSLSTTVNAAIDELGAPVFRSVVAQCPNPAFQGTLSNGAGEVPGAALATGVTVQTTAADVATVFGAGANNNSITFAPTLASIFINGASETAVPVFNPTMLNAFFMATTFVGTVENAADINFRSWTCNSVTADFGTGNSGLCTTLPAMIA